MKRILYLFVAVILSSFANALYASNVEIVCINPEVSGFSAYSEYQFSFTSDDKDIESPMWSLSLPKVSGGVETVELQDSAGFCKTPILTNLDNYISSDGVLSATLDLAYDVNGKQYNAEPYHIDFELKPKIFYAVIDSVKSNAPYDSYNAFYTVNYRGADKITVSVEEEYNPKLKTKYIYEQGIVNDVAEYITSTVCVWIDFTAENEYGKTVYTIELLPNGIVSGVENVVGNLNEYLEVYLQNGVKVGEFKSINDIKSAGITGIVIVRRIIGSNTAEVYKLRI